MKNAALPTLLRRYGHLLIGTGVALSAGWLSAQTALGQPEAGAIFEELERSPLSSIEGRTQASILWFLTGAITAGALYVFCTGAGLLARSLRTPKDAEPRQPPPKSRLRAAMAYMLATGGLVGAWMCAGLYHGPPYAEHLLYGTSLMAGVNLGWTLFTLIVWAVATATTRHWNRWALLLWQVSSYVVASTLLAVAAGDADRMLMPIMAGYGVLQAVLFLCLEGLLARIQNHPRGRTQPG